MSGQLLVHGRTPGVTVGLSEGQGLPPKQAERRGRSEAPEQGCLGCRQAWGAGRLGGATLGHTTPTAQSALDDPFHWTNWTRCFHYSLCSEEEPEVTQPPSRARAGLHAGRPQRWSSECHRERKLVLCKGPEAAGQLGCWRVRPSALPAPGAHGSRSRHRVSSHSGLRPALP